MRIMMMAAAASAGSLVLSASPASAQAQTAAPEIMAQVQSGDVATSYAQYRQRRYYAAPPRYYGRRHYAYPPRYYRRDRGNAAAAGIAGLAAGALIGGAIASQQAQAAPTYVVPNQSAVAYCAQRFRSYDPRSGTYLGYDGRRHACP